MSFKVNKSLLAGSASAVLCAVCLALYLDQVSGEVERARAEALARYGGEQIEVLVANRDIAAGEMVGDSMVDEKMWIADLLPEGAVTQRGDAVGRRLGTSVLEGEVLSSKRFYESASELDIPLGLTAVSIPVKDVQAVGGALEEGMTVDVYATGSSSTSLLIEDALVLATSTSEVDSFSTGSVSWITLAVDPSAVAELVSAAQNLELYLTLPNDPVGVVGSSGAVFLEGEEEAEVAGGQENHADAMAQDENEGGLGAGFDLGGEAVSDASPTVSAPLDPDQPAGENTASGEAS